jgi:hypothetical protein
MIGSTNRPIDSTRWNGSSSTQCTITTGTGIACTSDERLKTNIVNLSDTTLDNLLKVKTVTYNWLENPSSSSQVGFLAQDLETYFPQLVATDSLGYKSVYYAQMTPILVEAIREMNIKINGINDLAVPNSWRESILAWFESPVNMIRKMFVGEVETKNLCVSDDNGNRTCITKDKLDQILLNLNQTPAPATTITTPTPVELPPAESPAPVPQAPATPPAPELAPVIDVPAPVVDTNTTPAI